MDNFKEDIVVARSNMFGNIMYVLCWIFLVFFAIYSVFLMQLLLFTFDLVTLIMFLLGVGGAIMLFFAKDNFKVEYEYTFTNGSLDIAKVLRSVKRKELGSMTVANVAACGHVAHESFHKFLAMKDVSKRNWFVNRDGNLFYFYYVKENKKNMIIIEPSEEMVDMIRRYLPAGVYQG